MSVSNIEQLQKAGIIAKKHNLTKTDSESINKLSQDEIDALISVKNQLGVKMLQKTAKGGKFPHPDSFSY